MAQGGTNLTTGNIDPKLTPDFFNTSEYQLQLKENFIIVFEKNDILGDGFELLAESVTLPSRNVEQLEVPYANKMIKVAGRNTFTNLTINIRDVITKDTEYAITKWFESILNLKTGVRGIIGDETGKNGYKINIEIIALTPNGDKGRISIAKGCFPISCNFGELSYTSTGVRTLSIECSVDDFAREEVYTQSGL